MVIEIHYYYILIVLPRLNPLQEEKNNHNKGKVKEEDEEQIGRRTC